MATPMQLYRVAEKVDPDDWVTLGIRLGFDYNFIKHMKENKESVTDGIFTMLVTWLGMHPNYTKPDARKFLADQFKAMNKIDLAYFLISTEVGFVAPHSVNVHNLSIHFEYEVRSFQKEQELSFTVTMASTDVPLALSSVLRGLTGPGEFANELSTCMHVLGLRLTRIELENTPGSRLKFTVAANDEDGVRELRTRLMSKAPNHFREDLKRVICKYVSFDTEVSAISIQTTFSDVEFGQAIQSLRKHARSSFAGTTPFRVNNLEIVRLAQELDASMLTELGLNLGTTEAEMSGLSSRERRCRSMYENMLFCWKSKQHPCREDRTVLADIVESVGAVLLADKLRRGELRETDIEEQRRIYLDRASATCDLRTLMKNRPVPFMKHPKPPAAPYPDGPAAPQAQQHHKYVNDSQATTSSKHSAETDRSVPGLHDYVNTLHLQDKKRPLHSQDIGDPNYARVIYRPCHARPPTSPPEDVPVSGEPPYDTIKGGPRSCSPPPGEDHIYENDGLLCRLVQRNPVNRTSHKRHGTSTVPVIHNIDFSVLECMWDTLAMKNVTRSDTEHPAGLIRLAQTLQELGQSDIADTVWTALIKDYMKNDYLYRFVTGSIRLLPLVITNRQDIAIGQITTLEDVLDRTKVLEFPSRIFIEADKPEDREMVAEKLGYDWAMEKDPSSPLGNVDLLYVLKVADIAPGSTVGGAIESQRVCREFKLSPDRIEDYCRNTLTECMIVLKGDEGDFQKLLSVPAFDNQGCEKAGFRELVKDEYLRNCIVIMTVAPQATACRPSSFVHYKMKAVTTSDC